MLAQLSIRNLLLLKHCEIPFAHGLNVLTGETGAGKSILLDALGLVLGERSDASLIRPGETQASVSAEFDITHHTPLHAVLAELELADDNVLILRRSLHADGKSRAFVNDAPVSVATLKRLGELLVERHGQHDQRGLLDAKTHRALIDRYAGNATLLGKAAKAFAAWKSAAAELEDLRAAIAQAQREQEWLRHTVAELGKLKPEEGEELTLVETRARAQQASKALDSLNQALALLSEGDGIAPKLRQAIRSLGKTTWEGEGLATITAALERAELEVEEANVALEKLVAAAAQDPAEIEKAEDRLFTLRDMARKHHTTVDGLAKTYTEAAMKLKQLTTGQESVAAAEAAVAKALSEYRAASEALYAARTKAGAGLCKDVMKELKPLKMGSTKLQVVQQELPESQWGEAGMHQVSFEVATNEGMKFGPLSKVASGGELSRLLLAMKVVLRGDDDSSAIFDEIDTGTGGAVAEAIGLRLRQLAEHTQVLVVTHLPQVAAQAAHHLFIAKDGTRQVATKVTVLDQATRKEELARMLSGATISDEARMAAGKLLQAAS